MAKPQPQQQTLMNQSNKGQRYLSSLMIEPNHHFSKTVIKYKREHENSHLLRDVDAHGRILSWISSQSNKNGIQSASWCFTDIEIISSHAN
jgi:hypothetical protein